MTITYPGTWQDQSWLIIDIEHTGFGAEPGICELGAVIMREGVVVAHRSGLFNPGKPIHPMASKVHGIWDNTVAKCRHIREPNPKTGKTVAQVLAELVIEHDVQAVVGYNCRTSDLPIMRREMGADWNDIEDGIGLVVDPLPVVRAAHPDWKGDGGHKLEAVTKRLGLLGPEASMPDVELRAHWAVTDCVWTGRVLWALREHVPVWPKAAYRLMQPKTPTKRAAGLDFGAAIKVAGGAS